MKGVYAKRGNILTLLTSVASTIAGVMMFIKFMVVDRFPKLSTTTRRCMSFYDIESLVSSFQLG